MEWNAYDPSKGDERLNDHHYYLVSHKDFGTPMKAKYHSELGGIWEVFIGRGQLNGFVNPWDDPYPIDAWMKLPEKYGEVIKWN